MRVRLKHHLQNSSHGVLALVIARWAVIGIGVKLQPMLTSLTLSK